MFKKMQAKEQMIEDRKDKRTKLSRNSTKLYDRPKKK